MHILGFAASNSSKSINGQLVGYGLTLLRQELIPGCSIEQLNIHDYEAPIYSIDREQADGVAELAKQFYAKIGEADAIVISFAEHNGHYAAAYKSLFDWMSRIDRKVYQDKPTVMLATSPGGHGAARVLDNAIGSAETFGADLRGSLAVPKFHDNFDTDAERLIDDELNQALTSVLKKLS